jgi:NADH:ubiquinone oxidoreductase subunit E
MSAVLYERIQELQELYPPGTRSAVIPALRLAQEEYGWLSPNAIREVADALGLTPAYCHSVASFYDQFHLAPVGEHSVEVCTNVSCALYGAQQVLEAFEDELGCRAGETSADGTVTLSTIECLGGCGWGTIVAADGRYLHGVDPGHAPDIVKELRA